MDGNFVWFASVCQFWCILHVGGRGVFILNLRAISYELQWDKKAGDQLEIATDHSYLAVMDQCVSTNCHTGGRAMMVVNTRAHLGLIRYTHW
jgi:hypothetical protein